MCWHLVQEDMVMLRVVKNSSTALVECAERLSTMQWSSRPSGVLVTRSPRNAMKNLGHYDRAHIVETLN